MGSAVCFCLDQTQPKYDKFTLIVYFDSLNYAAFMRIRDPLGVCLTLFPQAR